MNLWLVESPTLLHSIETQTLTMRCYVFKHTQKLTLPFTEINLCTFGTD